MTSLLINPVSNADSERGFSILRKLETKLKPRKFLTALMVIKFKSLQCCYEATFTKELLIECKKATSEVVKI